MRNGFRSSRGAIRGTSGGAAGFTTVAIGVGPFLFSVVLRHSSQASLLAYLSPSGPIKSANLETWGCSAVCRAPQNAALIFLAALLGTEILRLAVGVHRQSQFLRHMHPTDRVP